MGAVAAALAAATRLVARRSSHPSGREILCQLSDWPPTVRLFMARLEDRLLNHPLHQHLTTVRGHLAEVSDETLAAADEHMEGAVTRAGAALTYIEGVLGAVDPALTTATALSGIESALSNAATAAAQLNGNPQTAAALDQHIEQALTAVEPMAAASQLTAKRAAGSAKTFDNALTATVKAVAEQAQSLEGELDALEQRRVDAVAQLEADEQQQRTTFQASIDSLTTSLNAEKARVDQLVATHQEQFTTAQQEQHTAFEQLRDQLQETGESSIAEFNERADETQKQLEKDVEAVLAEVRSRRDEVEELYGVITDTSTTGAFRDEAREQKKAADDWRKVAIGFGLAAAVLAVAFIVLSALAPDKASSTSAIIAKVTATLVAAGIAAYAGRQSGRHREREEEAKRLELELVAFPPFIDSLDDDQKRDVRKEFADRAFRGRPEQAPTRSLFRKQDSFGVGAPELLDALLKATQKSDGSPPA